ncbi:hypothetical protein [Marinoscillum pacificum]|uniref:hypothetical protein n=1 Tax=Marinoscillum pacificum TaxID=392723 RepID=UPI00215870DB|nr:hypothetical protein [Marinoscillum pacificum]
MKKISILIFLLGFSSVLKAQIQQYYGAWFNSADDLMIIYDTAFTSLNESLIDINGHITAMKVNLSNDTLEFWKENQHYGFVIEEQKPGFMSLMPISSQSKVAFNEKSVVFYRDYSFESPFSLKQLIYRDSCRGHYKPCTLCNVEINNEGEIRVIKADERWNLKEESSDRNYLSGQLDSASLLKLKYLLRLTGLHRYDFQVEYNPFNALQINSRSIKYYEVELEDKTVNFSTPLNPIQLRELNYFLYQLCHEFNSLGKVGREVD